MDSTTATGTAPAPINNLPMKPATQQAENTLSPTAIRYGWGMFGEINLAQGGSINLFVQPPRLQVGDEVIPNPYHRVLPSKQLIPFPSFEYFTQVPSQDRRNSMGRAELDTVAALMPALDAIILVMQRYGDWGFTMLRTLDGMEDQVKAFRIFSIVQPFGYTMKDMMYELETGYTARRDATQPLTLSPGYTIEPLRDDSERAKADALAAEMLAAATVSFNRANTILDTTETDIVRRLSGGPGKTGPDPLDRRLMPELGRTLPTVQSIHGGQATAAPADLSDLKGTVAGLVNHAELQQLREENARLRDASEAKAEDGATIPATVVTEEEPETGGGEPTGPTICGHIKDNGEPCRTPTKGGRCAHHKDDE